MVLRDLIVNSSSNYGVQFFLFTLWALVLSTGATCFQELVSRSAAGSGIPEMKSVFAGNFLYKFLTFRTLLSKVVGLSLALASGLSIGKEGPFVHIATIICHQLASHRVFQRLDSDGFHTLQILVSAASVGVSATFGAPLAGVIFSMEVTSTYYDVSTLAKAFLTASSGALMLRLIIYYSPSQFAGYPFLFTDSQGPANLDGIGELVACAVLGLVCGILSYAFVKGVVFCNHVYKRFERQYAKRLLSSNVILVTVLTAVLCFSSGEFMRQSELQSMQDLISAKTLIPSVWGTTLKSVILKLVIFIVLRFVLTLMAISLPIPAGCFSPLFLIGAAVGRLSYQGIVHMWPASAVLPDTWALITAAAFCSGVTHTVSPTVLVLELTGKTDQVVPVFVAVLISYGISMILTDRTSVYDAVTMIKGTPRIRDLNHEDLEKRASDIMRGNVAALPTLCTIAEIQESLRQPYQVYPLVRSKDRPVVVGTVHRAGLEIVLRHLLEENLRTAPASSVQEISLNSDLAEQELMTGTDSYIIDTATEVDLEATAAKFIDQAPFQVVATTPLTKVHFMFRILNLNMAIVTEEGVLVGVISRKDLMDGAVVKSSTGRFLS
eukprot:TRINITY_DN457_c0_g1_i4.p1 TRINITY_DN457_c0_g1~~TRINITY_DN457_c0_g1_i4.p1  ORF type:complete len:607 (-),score=37.74 TRINITY_DN457_c0_g1_i4:31-1851(-)